MARMRTQPSRSTMQQQHQNMEQPFPSPSAYEDGDIIYIDFEGRRVAIAWSASLETAKATACEDLGLTSHGYSAKDIAFFFHPSDDESKPLIEVMASAWTRMRPIPTLYLALAPLHHNEPSRSPRLDLCIQQQRSSPQLSPVQQYQHNRLLRHQASTLTNSAKSQRSRESDPPRSATTVTTEASMTESVDPAVRVDIESWRRNQSTHPYGIAQAPQHRIPLPHILPSPPLSADAQSQRATSPMYEEMTNSSCSASRHASSRSQNMDVEQHVRHYHHQQFASSQPKAPSDNAGFLAVTGRRTTIQFPHTPAGSSNGMDNANIIAPRPVRRSHSQELLNADYSNFKLTQHQQQQQQRPAEVMVSSSQRQLSATPAIQESSVHTYAPNVRQPVMHQMKHSATRSSHNLASRTEGMAVQGQHSLSRKDKPTMPAHSQVDRLRAQTVQRATSTSSLRQVARAILPQLEASTSPQGYQYYSPKTSSHEQAFDAGMERFMQRRASLPNTLESYRTSAGHPGTSEYGKHFPDVQQRRQTVGGQAVPQPTMTPIEDMDMQSASSFDASEEQDLQPALIIPDTPKRRQSDRTLRRLKSSPGGLKEQYTWQGLYEDSPMPPVPHSSLPDPFSLSNKRGPTSWPNSPVKRNASLFSQSPPQASESFTNKVLPFHVPFEANERKHKSLMKRKQLSALPPPPPPPPIALTAATAAGLETAGEGAISRALLSGNLPGFLSDTRRPDSPMPPVSSSTGRTLRSSPLALSMANEHAAAFTPYNMPPSSSSRFRTRSSQSADEMFNTSSIPDALPMPPSMPKTRSHVNLASVSKGRKSRAL